MKFRKFYAKAMALFLLMVFTINSSGFMLYKHHCNTANSNEVSIFIEDFSCKHDAESQKKIENKTHSCCHAKPNAKVEDENCCKTISHYYKLDSDLHRNAFNLLTISCPIILSSTFVEKANIEIPIISKNYSKIESPPLFGFDYIFSLHQAKIFEIL